MHRRGFFGCVLAWLGFGSTVAVVAAPIKRNDVPFVPPGGGYGIEFCKDMYFYSLTPRQREDLVKIISTLPLPHKDWLIWIVPNGLGMPAEFVPIPISLATLQSASADYPSGRFMVSVGKSGYRVSIPAEQMLRLAI